jgi:hypothetical protein
MCRSCARYERQLRFVRDAAGRLSQHVNRQAAGLSQEARQRIKAAIAKNSG